MDLLHFCQSLPQPVTFITRLRLDAGLYEPAPARRPGQNGRPRVKGRRLPMLRELIDHSTVVPWEQVAAAWYDGATRTVEISSQTAVWYHTGKPPVPIRWVLIRDPQGEFAPQALLCTSLAVAPAQILEWFVLRWQLEVTFHETRAHLGVETQRQWSDRAIARTTPILMGLFSWVTLAAHLLQQQHPIIHRTAAWYAKPAPTFADAIALMRRHLWLASGGFSLSARDTRLCTYGQRVSASHAGYHVTRLRLLQRRGAATTLKNPPRPFTGERVAHEKRLPTKLILSLPVACVLYKVEFAF